MEAEIAAQDIAAEVSGAVGLVDSLLATLVGLPDLAVDVVVSALAAHGIGRDRHALDQDVRVVAHDVAVLERTGLSLVGVAHQVLGTMILLRHEPLLENGLKTRNAPT